LYRHPKELKQTITIATRKEILSKRIVKRRINKIIAGIKPAPSGIHPNFSSAKGIVIKEQVGISKEAVKRLILKEWRSRLENLDPNFFVDESLSPEEQEKLIVNKYDEISRTKWEEKEQEFFKRAEFAGVSYEKKLYPSGNTPIELMAKNSREFFYFGRKWDPTGVYDGGAMAVMDNDSELGSSFQDPRVVSGGLFITHTSAGSKVARYLRKESSVESTGMVLSTGISNAREVFPGIRKALRQVLNVPEVQEMAYHQGMFNIVPDQSGAARYYTMVMDAPVFQQTLVLKDEVKNNSSIDIMSLDNYDSKIVAQYFTYPSLVLEMLRVANGYNKVTAGFKDNLSGIFLERDKGFSYSKSKEEKKFLENYYSKERFLNLLPKKIFFPLDFKGDISVNFYGYGGRWESESHIFPSS